MNSLMEPEHITTVEKEIRIPQKTLETLLDPYSLTVIKLKYK